MSDVKQTLSHEIDPDTTSAIGSQGQYKCLIRVVGLCSSYTQDAFRIQMFEQAKVCKVTFIIVIVYFGFFLLPQLLLKSYTRALSK